MKWTLLGLAALSLGSSQEPQGSEWFAVEKWWGSFSAVYSVDDLRSGVDGSGKPFYDSASIRARLSGEFVLDTGFQGAVMPGAESAADMMRADRLWGWHLMAEEEPAPARLPYEMHAVFENEHYLGGEGNVFDRFWKRTTREAGGIAEMFPVYTLVLDVERKQYGLQLGTMTSLNWNELEGVEEVVSVRQWSWGGSETTTSSRTVPGGLSPNGIEGNCVDMPLAKLPDEVGPLRGSATQTFGVGRLTVSWTLFPTPPPPVELLLEEEARYDDWRPNAGLDEQTPGRSLRVAAKLVNPEGGEVRDKARRIRFALERVTREPGVCINWPREPGAEPLPDLRFLEGANPSLDVTADGLTAIALGTDLESAEVVLHSFDWGAFGVLVVEAELESGRTLIAKRARSPGEISLRIPRSRPGSWIAESWRAQAKATGSDDSDDETTPRGDSNPGDGLTLYEEYRGFLQSGRWTPADPGRKDFFVVDLSARQAAPGIRKFQEATQLAVHYRLTQDEVDAQRVLNHATASGPHRVDQHAVLIEPSATETDPRAIGGPGTPKSIQRVALPASFLQEVRRKEAAGSPLAGTMRDYLAAAVAHELLHCCNVYHHGERDEWEAVLTFPPGNSSPGVALMGGRTVSVREENGTPKPPSTSAQKVIHLGHERGQHSGATSCLMRYDCADAYSRDNQPDILYWVSGTEQVGTTLCTDPKGTDVNAEGRNPRVRYGGCDSKRGACAAQLVVNDAVNATIR